MPCCKLSVLWSAERAGGSRAAGLEKPHHKAAHSQKGQTTAAVVACTKSEKKIVFPRLRHRLTNRYVIRAGITHRPFNWQLQYKIEQSNHDILLNLKLSSISFAGVRGGALAAKIYARAAPANLTYKAVVFSNPYDNP